MLRNWNVVENSRVTKLKKVQNRLDCGGRYLVRMRKRPKFTKSKNFPLQCREREIIGENFFVPRVVKNSKNAKWLAGLTEREGVGRHIQEFSWYDAGNAKHPGNSTAVRSGKNRGKLQISATPDDKILKKNAKLSDCGGRYLVWMGKQPRFTKSKNFRVTMSWMRDYRWEFTTGGPNQNRRKLRFLTTPCHKHWQKCKFVRLRCAMPHSNGETAQIHITKNARQ